MDSPAETLPSDDDTSVMAASPAAAAQPRWVMPVLWAMFALGLSAALYSANLRVRADAVYRDVMLLVDWHDLNGLPEADPGAQLAGFGSRETPWVLMAELPGAYVCYGEETVGSLVESGILRRAEVLSTAPTFEVALSQYADDVVKGAQLHGYALQRDADDRRGRLLVQFPALPEIDLLMLPVCWREDVIDLTKSKGVPLILRPGGTEFISDVPGTLASCQGQPLLLFQGPQVLGYRRRLGEVARLLKAQGQRFAWVEFDEQDGGAALASRMGPEGLVRLHSIPSEEMVNYNVAGAIDRYLRAARERSIRVLYVRPFIRGQMVDHTPLDEQMQQQADKLGGVIAYDLTADYPGQLFSANYNYFRGLKSAVEADGFRIAPTVTTPQDGPGRWVRLPIMLGAAGGILWLLALWFPGLPARWWTLLVPAAAGGGGVGSFSSAAFSAGLLIAAIAFPLLGLWLGWTLYQRRTHSLGTSHPLRLGWALLALLLTSLVSIAGGLLIHGGLWDAGAMLKLEQFRGVSLALALPALLLAAYAWQGESLQDSWDSVRRTLAPYWQRFLALWTSPIRYGDVAFIMIALGALAIVMLRSGNDGPLGPLDMEMLFRGTLEDVFSVRPRTKELLGHPLLVLFFLSLPWRNRAAVLFALAGLLGQVSILNTFCHLHTPLLLTVQRVGLGLVIGLTSALLWGAVALLVGFAWERLRRN